MKKQCPCGKWFYSHHGNRKYCSASCPRRRPRLARPAYVVNGPPRACRLCGEVFQPRQPNQLFCTRAHMLAARKQEERELYNGDHRRRRRAWEPIVATGGVVCSWPDCGELILPGEPWDLGHWPPPSRPQHQRCNRKTGGRRRPEPGRIW